MGRLRTVVAVLFCLSELFWFPMLFIAIGGENNPFLVQLGCGIVLPLIACLISERWTIGIGLLSGYITAVSPMLGFEGDPQGGGTIRSLTIYIAGPIMSLMSLPMSICITWIRILRAKVRQK